jgi:hypothetical protein
MLSLTKNDVALFNTTEITFASKGRDGIQLKILVDVHIEIVVGLKGSGHLITGAVTLPQAPSPAGGTGLPSNRCSCG